MPGPVEVGVQVGAQEASSLEVNVAHLALLPKPVQRMLTEVLYQMRCSSLVWREAEPLVVGCPGCGCWRGHEAYLVKGYCPPPLTLHS